jgi:hypothetical protein
MSSLFDQFIGNPIDWDNPLNMTLVFQISAERNPEQMRTEVQASSIDPNELVSIGDLLVQFQSKDHARVAWEEALHQFDSAPNRIAPDVNLVNVKRNLCIANLSSAPLESFRWISEEPQIARDTPMVAIELAESLRKADNYQEAELVLRELDGIPIEVLADLFPDAEKGANAVRGLRISVRGTLCKRSIPGDPVAAFGWIAQEPGIVQADPKLALSVAVILLKMNRFGEAGVVFTGIDQIPDRTLAEALSGSPLGIEGVNYMRVEIYKRSRFNSLPSRWDMEPGDVLEHMAIVEDGLQRRVGLGQSDTLVNLSLLAVSGDRRAIPLFVLALSHHKHDIQTEGALGLYLHGDPRGLRWLMSQDTDRVIWSLRLLRDPTAMNRVAEWEKAKASQTPNAAIGRSPEAIVQNKPKKKGLFRSLLGG